MGRYQTEKYNLKRSTYTSYSSDENVKYLQTLTFLKPTGFIPPRRQARIHMPACRLAVTDPPGLRLQIRLNTEHSLKMTHVIILLVEHGVPPMDELKRQGCVAS